jgi:hypothetical protein
MRILLLGLVALLASATVSLAKDAPYHAGFLALEVEAEPPFAVGVWYPARADEPPGALASMPLPPPVMRSPHWGASH